jgi:hypothetical protein
VNEEAETMLRLHLGLIKAQMKNDGLIFGFAIDTKDINNSKLCFINKDKYIESGEMDGLMISLTDLNKDLF